jgi:hypothetical protein
MSPESSGPTEPDDARSPGDDGWPDDAADGPDPDWPDDAADGPDPDWPDDAADERDPDWPDDAADERDPDWPDDWPDEGADDPPWRRAAPPAAYGLGAGPGQRSARPFALAAVALLALAVGAGVALAIGNGLDHSSSPSTAPSSQPSFAAPGGGSTVPGGGAIPGGGGPVGEGSITGQVEAVSSTSITIGGPGQSMTAAITAATKVTGKVTSIGEVKVGDRVSAQITMSGGQATVTAIQDPAQAPSSGGGPP